MLIDPIQARDLKMELFEQPTIEELQDELVLWLSTRTEERVIGLSFEASDIGATASYRAYVLYTE